MFNIVLIEPEIPQNTGNIARTCACTGSSLHLIRPFKFEINDKTLKRAGLDYWDKLQVFYYDDLDDFFNKNRGGEYYFIETGGEKNYSQIKYPQNTYLFFGKETTGIDKDILHKFKDRVVSIPMSKNLRSLNLSNCVAIVLYEALRQHGFEALH